MQQHRSSRVTPHLATLALALAGVALPLHQAVGQQITFPESDFPLGPTTPILDGYGATSGVGTTYRSLETFGDAAELGDMRWWDGGHGGLHGVAYGVNATASVAEVGLFSLGPGNPVTLSGFDIGSWSNFSRTLYIQVLGWDYSVLLDFTAPVDAQPFSFAAYLANVGADAPTHAEGIRIQWTQDRTPATPEITGRGSYDAGIDNIAFTGGTMSTVPEPSSVVLLASGLAGLALASRRVRRRVTPPASAPAAPPAAARRPHRDPAPDRRS